MACDTKARTQRHVEKELAKPAAAAATASHFTYRRTKSLETEGDLGKQGRSARRPEADQVPGNRKQSNSKMDVDTHLSDTDVSTNAFLQNEAVKEELTDTNTKAIERVKIGSNNICIREDLANVKTVFSQESSQAIFEMGNVELIELKTSMIECPSWLDNSLPVRKSHKTLSGYDATNQSCF